MQSLQLCRDLYAAIAWYRGQPHNVWLDECNECTLSGRAMSYALPFHYAIR